MLPAKAIDIALNRKLKTTQIRVIYPKSTALKDTMKWYNSPGVTEPIIKTAEIPSAVEVPIHKIPQLKLTQSYWNLTNLKSLNRVEVINKFVVDSQIDFELPQQPCFLFYDLIFEGEQIIQVPYSLFATPREKA